MNKQIPSTERPVPDDALIRAYLSGEARAFDALVNRHKDRVFNLCYRFLGDYHEADDTAQEVFIKVFRSLNRFRFESAFSTWVYRIAVNACKNRINSIEYRYKKWMRRLDAAVPSLDCEAQNTAPEASNTPVERLEQKERAEQISRALSALSGNKKTVAVLRDIEGLSYEEISRITGLKPGTVKSTLARARADLQKRLRGLIP